jgi:hypothetical protein
MTLIVAIQVPEGIVIAADSRIVTAFRRSSFDNVRKIGQVDHNGGSVGVAFYGKVNIGTSDADARPALDLLADLPNREWRDKAGSEIAAEIGAFYAGKWRDAGMGTNVPERGRLGMLVFGSGLADPRPAVHKIVIPDKPQPETILSAGRYGMVAVGESNYAERLLYGIDPTFYCPIQNASKLSDGDLALLRDHLKERGELVEWAAMPLQDAVNVADFVVHVTERMQGWCVGDKGVGGPVDIAITESGGTVRFLRQKVIETRRVFNG